jgi:hypothetical protein
LILRLVSCKSGASEGGPLLAALAGCKSGASEGGPLLAAHALADCKSGASEGGPLLAAPKSGVSEDSALMGACLGAMWLIDQEAAVFELLPAQGADGIAHGGLRHFAV